MGRRRGPSQGCVKAQHTRYQSQMPCFSSLSCFSSVSSVHAALWCGVFPQSSDRPRDDKAGAFRGDAMSHDCTRCGMRGTAHGMRAAMLQPTLHDCVMRYPHYRCCCADSVCCGGSVQEGCHRCKGGAQGLRLPLQKAAVPPPRLEAKEAKTRGSCDAGQLT